jgi:hypothetical protein
MGHIPNPKPAIAKSKLDWVEKTAKIFLNPLVFLVGPILEQPSPLGFQGGWSKAKLAHVAAKMVAQSTEPLRCLSPGRECLVNVNPVKVVTVTRTEVINAIENIGGDCLTATSDKSQFSITQVPLELLMAERRVEFVLDVKAGSVSELDSKVRGPVTHTRLSYYPHDRDLNPPEE